MRALRLSAGSAKCEVFILAPTDLVDEHELKAAISVRDISSTVRSTPSAPSDQPTRELPAPRNP
jgi:hypothetical protein